ncbi:MAG: ABC transporter permease [Deltaproteobacteria bacterium]|nr:ABC transporter permease [Deltaproteobacteria bacterium]
MSDSPEADDGTRSPAPPPEAPAVPATPAPAAIDAQPPGPPWHARWEIRWLLFAAITLGLAVVCLVLVETDEILQLDYGWARPAAWGAFVAGVLQVFVATLVGLGTRQRRVVWIVFDVVLLVSTIVISVFVEIPGADKAATMREVLSAAARIGLTFFLGVRVVARVAPPLLDVAEQIGFRSLVAVRHLRAKKSGFLTAIAFLSILGVALSSCALTTTIGVMSGFGDDLKQKILGNHAHVVVDRNEGTFEAWQPVLARVRGAPGVSAATPYVASEVMLSSATNLSGVMLRGIDPASIGAVTDLSRNMRAGRLRYLTEPERLLDLPPDEARGILQPLSPPRPRRRTEERSNERRNSVFDTDFSRDRPIPAPDAPRAPAPAWATDSGVFADGGSSAASSVAPSGSTETDSTGNANATADEAARRAAEAVTALLDQSPIARIRRDAAASAINPDRVAPDDDADGAADAGDDEPARDASSAAHARDEGDEEDDDSLFPDPLPPTADEIVARDEIDVLPGIVIGAELARNLRLFVGDEVNVVSPHGALGPAGPMPKSRPFRVAGIFYSGMYEYDAKYAYVLLPVAQSFVNVGTRIHGIEIRVTEPENAPVVAAAVRRALGRNDLRVRDWQELNRNLFSALRLERLAMFIVLGIAILVASFCIVCTLLLMVLEKGREIAILKTMGAGDEEIRRVFMIEGVIIGMAGAALGLALGYTMSFSAKHLGIKLDPEVYYIDRLPVHIELSDYAFVALAALAVCFLSTLYPAHAASKLRPVDALRYE